VIDFAIIGSGLTGATIARLLHDAGKSVIVFDRRTHIGGNVYDEKHQTGITIHKYGPHYFRTSSDKVWNFVTQFSHFYTFEASILSKISDEYYHWPVWESEISKLSDGPIVKSDKPANLEEAALSLMPRKIYELFVKEYNEKQWGVSPTKLAAELCARFDVRTTNEPRLKPDAKYQGLPINGYTGLMLNMLDGIKVELGVPFAKVRGNYKHIVYTGPIDEFFNYEFGKLSYRGQMRDHSYHNGGLRQPVVQVNYPLHVDGPQIRSIEWRHLLRDVHSVNGTIITTETTYTPSDPNDFEYPFPDLENKLLYEKYRALANNLSSITIAGRLGEYKYYDMDQAIARAIKVTNKLIGD
jgi:UDP-galactopyranose mutase